MKEESWRPMKQMRERTKGDGGSKIRRISWMRPRQREDVKIRKCIKNVP